MTGESRAPAAGSAWAPRDRSIAARRVGQAFIDAAGKPRVSWHYAGQPGRGGCVSLKAWLWWVSRNYAKRVSP